MAYPTGITSARAAAMYAAYLSPDLLELVEKTIVMDQFGDPEDIPGNFSDTIEFHRTRKLTKKTSQLLETDSADTVDPSPMVIDKISATLESYGDYIRLTKKNVKVEVHKSLDEAKSLFHHQSRETIDWQIMINVAPFLAHYRIDEDSTYQKIGTESVNSATQATTTTARTTLTQVDDFWNGGYIRGTSGANKDVVRQVTDFANANGLLTFNAFPSAMVNGDTFDIVIGTSITALDVLTADIFNRVEVDMFDDGAMPKLIGKNGSYYACVISNRGRYDFRRDPTWVAMSQHTDEALKKFEKGLEGKIYGSFVYRSNQGYRETVAGVQSDTGVVHNTLFIGDKCYGTSRLKNADGSGIAALQMWVKAPDNSTLDQPWDKVILQPSWEIWFKTIVKNASWGRSVLHGAS